MSEIAERQHLLATSCWRMLFGGMVLGGALAAYVPHVVLFFVCTLLMWLAAPLLAAWQVRTFARRKAQR